MNTTNHKEITMRSIAAVFAALLVALTVALGASAEPAGYTLAVKRSAPGGTITGSSIECGWLCWGQFEAGSQVELEAHPAFGWKFVGWSWDGAGCGEHPTCTVTLDSDRWVMATFAPPQP